MLELKHVCYAVQEGDTQLGILNDISLTIGDHKLVVFTGPNGGGKTTLAKIVMGRINHKSGAHHGENSPADQLTDLEVYILPNCQHLLRGRLENCVCRKHIFPGEMRASCGLRCCYPQET